MQRLWTQMATKVVVAQLLAVVGCSLTVTLAHAAPEDALKFLQNTGQTGVAQNVGLDAAKKSEVEALANDLAVKTGSKAYIVLLKRDEGPQEYGSLYERLNMKGKDILIASNGTQWEVKVAALSHEAKQAAVDRALASSGDAKPIPRLKIVANELTLALSQAKGQRLSWNEFQAANAGKGWSGQRMSSEYDHYKTSGQLPSGTLATVGHSAPVPHTAQSAGIGFGTWAFLGALVAAIVGVVIWRRRKRDADVAGELKQMLSGPENVMTDVYMNMDGLENHPRFGQLLDAANACQAKLDELKRGPATREAVAKARSLNDEANRVRRTFDEAKMAR